jgi:HSP20 family protein
MKITKRKSEPTAIESMRREMDRFFDELTPFSWMRETNGGSRMDVWAPNTDMSEDENEYVIKMDIPGMTKDDIEVNFEDNRITIRGERSEEEREEKKDYIRKERYKGSFYRSITIPKTVDEDQIKAKFEEGVLKVNLPKAEVSKPKEVKVE